MLYNSEEDFVNDLGIVTEKAVDFIVNSEKYKEFNSMDMNQFAINLNLPSKSIFSNNHIGKHLISIDMKKANFSSLKYFGVLKDFASYDDFIKQFTNKEYIIKCKKIREIIFGKTNSKRLGTYEKYLMKKVYDGLVLEKMENLIVAFSNDEIIIDVSNVEDIENTRNIVKKIVDDLKDIVPFHIEEYVLKRIYPISSYIKCFMDGTYEVKATDSMYIPMVIRFLKGEEPSENDLVFEYDGQKAKFLKTQKLYIGDKAQ